MSLSPLELVGLAATILLILIAVAFVLRRRSARVAAPPAPAPDVVAFLERLGEGDGPRIYSLHRPLVVVGRSEDSDIRILSAVAGAQTVSRRHAQIRREDVEHVIEDLGSQNGIQVNGLATHRNLLRDGYRVAFGSVEFVYRRPGSGDAARSNS